MIAIGSRNYPADALTALDSRSLRQVEIVIVSPYGIRVSSATRVLNAVREGELVARGEPAAKYGQAACGVLEQPLVSVSIASISRGREPTRTPARATPMIAGQQ